MISMKGWKCVGLHADTGGQGEAALDSSSCSRRRREADSSTKRRRASTGSCNCTKPRCSGAVASKPSVARSELRHWGPSGQS